MLVDGELNDFIGTFDNKEYTGIALCRGIYGKGCLVSYDTVEAFKAWLYADFRKNSDRVRDENSRDLRRLKRK